MKFYFLTILFLSSIVSSPIAAQDWSQNATLPGNEKCIESHQKKICFKDGNRKNILELDKHTLAKYLINGSRHSLDYPVEITPLKLPYNALEKFFNAESNSPIRRLIFRITNKISPFKSFEDLFNWLGLHHYPQTTAEMGPNIIADMGDLEQFHMGVSDFFDNDSRSLTFGCAACHSNNLFGTKVLGMTNRFPKANEFFIMGKKLLSKTNAAMFKVLVGPTKTDLEHYKNAKEAIKYVELKAPMTLGLDTSLAQVGLSLATRNADAWATKPKHPLKHDNPLKHKPADSKPAVWWNLKYKTKWLSDGSIIAGNPIFTNFLWNEIGRGVDLKKLAHWLEANQQTVNELTSYVFYTEAPRYNDFFPNRIDLKRARLGEQLYLNNCKSCHGIYEKGWSDPTVEDYQSQIATTKVWYHKQTPTIDVQTDSYRFEGMNYFSENLNQLELSKQMNTIVSAQKGYIPPALVGIWARWPYFHNNSVPTLYDVLTPESKRPKKYIATPSEDKVLDFDDEKNGYPAPQYIKEPYKHDPDYLYDTTKMGMSNKGHTKMLLNENGLEKFSHEDKLNLIHFLKSL